MTDIQALFAIKNEIIDPFESLISWNESVPLCQWHGVVCGTRNQRVTELNLLDQKLTGVLSPFVGNLSFLIRLDIGNNTISGNIPPELGRLTRLSHLYLQNNSLHGDIPVNLSLCTNLVELWAYKNNLVGVLPRELGFLTKLKYFDFSYNKLSGEIPKSYSNFSSLLEMYLLDNDLEGKIPDEFGKLKSLKIFDADFNRLSGKIPSSLFNLTSLKVIDVSVNQLEGTLPRDLGINLPNLVCISISENRFSGSLPYSLFNLTGLEYLIVGKNNLGGRVPRFDKLHNLFLLGMDNNHFENDLTLMSSLTNATNLNRLYLQHNAFGGTFHEFFSNLSSNLAYVDLSSNWFSGHIPIEIGKFVNLEELRLSGNQLTGIIPPTIGKIYKLRYLHMSHNRVSGSIPFSIANLSLLTELNLDHNNLRGRIPLSVGKCQNLLYLNLNQNNLIGSIPKEICLISSLVVLNLSSNNLTGALPKEIDNQKNLLSLDVSLNYLTGEIPSTLGSCVTIVNLTMKRNLFRGVVPSTLSSLKSLQVLDLSCNKLSGMVPKYFEGFALHFLNLSFNDFEGALPERGIFENVSVVSFVGNPRICGGVPGLKLPNCNFSHSKKINFKLVILVILGILGLVVMVCAFFFYGFRRSKRTFPSLDKNLNQLIAMSYQSILKVTNGFSTSNLIGVGSHGYVYKGILEMDGKHVAIKVMNLLQYGAIKSFIAECEALRNVRHRNLVKLLTACSSVDYRGNEFKALVYEFMANGSLEDWLHPDNSRPNVQPTRLGFLQRLNIAIDVASAIHYLHNDCQISIVHCDLKPSNILLDNELVAHVGDFGLARFLHLTDETTCRIQTSSTTFKGSIGYIAPEYGMGSEPSTQGDVYSFGIVLLEMLTGKRPTDEMFGGNLSLHDFVRNAIPDGALEIVDPILNFEEIEIIRDRSPFPRFMRRQKMVEGLISLFGVGIVCSMYDSSKRKSINEVVRELCSIRDSLVGCT
ncbi:probable LRR receptor-like serine/threonine-protein kinase At3g47570 [Solanum dulcamara]|uniref:probable LRR receptor-like serine/threonine-protein kinase At3g47570 n=1 Tax=Solanum dulcamara TaxID=45834 RepID=UPI0024853E30|nr:probable LRR receptor-like serine/threonine-protein kinase At3g47570 [Solanum dulcamara]